MNFAIILAAGKGERMKTESPKCAVPLLGKPMVSYLVDAVNKTTIDKAICVIGHKKEVFIELLGDSCEYAYQEKQMGTAHAVKCAKDIIGNKRGYSIIIPGDTPLIDETIIQSLIDSHFANKNKLTIGTIHLENPFGYGRIIRKDDYSIVKIVEQRDATDEEKLIKEINSGLMCVDNQVLFNALEEVNNNNARGEYYLTDIVEIIANNNLKIGSFTIKDAYKLAGINDLYHLYEVETELRKEINKKHMMNGVIFENADSITIGPDVEIESNATIRQGTIILGKSKVEAHAVVGPYSEINNGVIREGAKCIQSLVNDSELGKNATLGPFSHLRAHTVVGEDDRIGNFVEIKNSTLGRKTNVAHLTYIGDTTCGGGVNWGCGTVTINYDGKNKFRTNIGDNVFIGCNSNLVAPINIASNTFIAAGSTLTDDLEEGDFSIARVKQVTKKGYALKYGFKKI